MGSLFRQRIIRYVDRQGRRCRSTTRGAVKVEEESSRWYGQYTDAAGVRHRVPLSESKTTAARMLRRLEGAAELASVGIVDRHAVHEARPLTEHLADFERDLAARGNVEAHVSRTVSYVRAILDGCDFVTISDLSPSAVAEFLHALRRGKAAPQLPAGVEVLTAAQLAGVLGVDVASVWRLHKRGKLATTGEGLRGRGFARETVEAFLANRRGVKGIGATTSNAYRTAVKAFSAWLQRTKKTAEDLLHDVPKINAAVDPRHVRRILEPHDFAALLASARSSSVTFRGLSGADRADLYATAARTGLRASELASLTPASIDHTSDPPTLTVAARHSKHRREDVLPVRADVAAILKARAEGRDRGEPLWPATSWPASGAEAVRLDMEAAGLAYADAEGRVYDFHGLRHQFVSELAAAGVHPRVAQDLARHSSITLTMKTYTHSDLSAQRAALEKLPDVGQKPPVE